MLCKSIKNVQTCNESIHCNILSITKEWLILNWWKSPLVPHNILYHHTLTLTQFSTQLSFIVDFPRKHVVMATINVPLTRRQLEHLLREDIPVSPQCIIPLPPINIPILYKKHLIWLKLGAFYNHLLKIHPIYVSWTLELDAFIWDENLPDRYTKICEKAPQKAGTYRSGGRGTQIIFSESVQPEVWKPYPYLRIFLPQKLTDLTVPPQKKFTNREPLLRVFYIKNGWFYNFFAISVKWDPLL